MPATGLLDLPLECLRAILKEAVAQQCPWSLPHAEDDSQLQESPASSDSDSDSMSEFSEQLTDSESDPDSDSDSEAFNSRGSTADIRVVLQWRLVNHIFDQEVMMCIEDAELLRPGKWHDINICPACNCQAPVDSLSSFAASFIIRQPSSGKHWTSDLPTILNKEVDEVFRQQYRYKEQITQKQRHSYLKIMYQPLLEELINGDEGPCGFMHYDHELLPGAHPNHSLMGLEFEVPESNVTYSQILLGQLEPVWDFIRSKDPKYNRHFSSASSHDAFFGILVFAAAKTGQHDLAREIMNQGVNEEMKHVALVSAFERKDLLMMQLLLDTKYKHSRSEGRRRTVIEALILRSTQLDMREITNTLLDHAEYLTISFISKVFSNACCNGDNDLVRRLFKLHRHIDVNEILDTVYWHPELFDLTPLTPVEIAAIRGHESTLRLLLKNGADPYAGRAKDDCVMKAAATGGHVGIARIILDAGVTPSPEQWRRVVGRYTRGRECGSQSCGFIRFLLDENHLNISMYLRHYPQELFEMVRDLSCAGDVAAVKLFAAHGMPMYGNFYSGTRRWTPMDFAATHGLHPLIEALEELGAPRPEYPALAPRRGTITSHHPFSPQEVSLRCSQSNCAAHAPERWPSFTKVLWHP
ncbi:hypothetical protein PG991_016303 [Apiospora marii]|uniref:Ankyrin n=1 Tax=Apiospora marii TaxID=335849 RepID=A0ABR1R0M9_9PEZI